MKKPIILITGGPAFDPLFRKESRMLNKTYPAAITAAGGIPVMDLYEADLEEYYSDYDNWPDKEVDEPDFDPYDWM